MANGQLLRNTVRAVPGVRPIVRGFRSVWESARPFPVPHYVDVPRWVAGEDPWAQYTPPTADQIGALATSERAAAAVLTVIDQLTPYEGYALMTHHYRASATGAPWRYADLSTALWAAATLLKPNTYLEVGVNRGRGLAIVGSVSPSVSIYGFDLWVPEYNGASNPGSPFVEQELKSAGHRGVVHLVSGDSRRTLPAFLAERPKLYFDMITVDGDKSVRVFAGDMANALPRLKIGGVLVVDDLAAVPALRRVWDRIIDQDSRFSSWEFAYGDYGVAFAVRTR